MSWIKPKPNNMQTTTKTAVIWPQNITQQEQDMFCPPGTNQTCRINQVCCENKTGCCVDANLTQFSVLISSLVVFLFVMNSYVGHRVYRRIQNQKQKEKASRTTSSVISTVRTLSVKTSRQPFVSSAGSYMENIMIKERPGSMPEVRKNANEHQDNNNCGKKSPASPKQQLTTEQQEPKTMKKVRSKTKSKKSLK